MILDTNALSAFSETNHVVHERISQGVGPYLPVVVIAEYRYGLLSSRDRARRLVWLDSLVQHWTVLDVALETTVHYAEIREWLKQRATPIPVNDLWIASLARQHSMPVLTNDAHFRGIPGVDVLGF